MTRSVMFLTDNINVLLTVLLVVVLAIYVVSRRTSTGSTESTRRTDRLALGTLAVYSVLLVALGLRHQGLTNYSVEWDFLGYAQRAQTASTAFAVNPRTPFGYPLSLWMLGQVTGDLFVSGKLLTGFSTLVVLGFTYLLGRRLFTADVGLFAVLGLVATTLFAEHTILVGTDMLAIACLLASLYLLLLETEHRVRSSILAGILGGLSYLVRPSAIVLVPAVLLWLWLPMMARTSSAERRRPWRIGLLYAASFGLAITPQLILSTIHTGNPFYNNRAMDIWMDMYGNWDWALLPEVANITLREVLLKDPVGFVLHWGENLLGTLRNSLLDWPLALFAVPGALALPWRAWRPGVGLLYWFGAGYLALVSVAWSPLSYSRVFLPLLPMLALIAAWLFFELNPTDLRLGPVTLPWREILFLLGLITMIWRRPYYTRFLEPGLERSHELAVPDIGHPLASNLDNKAYLLGYDISPEQARPGETVHLTLYWRAGFVGDVNYTVFTHVIDREGQMWVGQDNWPQAGNFPTSLWLAGEIVTDRYELALPSDIPPGEYRIEVGMYLLETMERLPVLGKDAQTEGSSIVFPGFGIQAP
jgi:hypothetical protein